MEGLLSMYGAARLLKKDYHWAKEGFNKLDEINTPGGLAQR
jgi:hypothetical protein